MDVPISAGTNRLSELKKALESAMKNDSASQIRHDKLETVSIIPTCGRACILNLPNELLLKIFEILLAWRAQERHRCRFGRSGYGSIEDIRLTCRRFCAVGSHLLLHRVTAHLNKTSFVRLANISHHPTLSKAIECVEINLSYFDRHLANDIEAFEQDTCHSFNHIGRASQDPSFKEIVPPSRKLVRTLGNIVDALPGVSHMQGAVYRQWLREAQVEYKSLWMDQQGLLAIGFSDYVASVVAKMPSVKRVEFCDDTCWDHILEQSKSGKWPYHQGFSLRGREMQVGSDLHHCFPWLGRSWKWAQGYQDLAENWLLPGLPVAFLSSFKRAGIRLSSLKLSLPLCEDMKSFRVTRDQLNDLKVLGQDISEFELSAVRSIPSQRGESLNLREESWALKLVKNFVGAILHDGCQQALIFNLRCFLDQSTQWSFGDVFPVKPFLCLQTIALHCVVVHLSDLQTIIGSSSVPIRVTLRDVVFLTGTWAEALDLLHGKGTEGSLCELTRGDCLQVRESKDMAMWSDIFGHVNEGENAATQCILGLHPNPLEQMHGPPISVFNDGSADRRDSTDVRQLMHMIDEELRSEESGREPMYSDYLEEGAFQGQLEWA